MKKRIMLIVLSVLIMASMLFSCTKKDEEKKSSSVVPSGSEKQSSEPASSSVPAVSSSEPVPSSEPEPSPSVPVSSSAVSSAIPEPEPEPEPEPKPEPEPEPEPEKGPYMKELELNKEHVLDINFDGKEDVVKVTEKKGQYDNTYTIQIKSSALKKEYKKTIKEVYGGKLYVVEADTDDKRLDLIFTYYYDSDDEIDLIMRINKSGNKIKATESYLMIGEMEKGGIISAYVGSDILGTHSLKSGYVLLDGEFRNIDGVWYYPEYDDDDGWIEVIKDMPVLIRISETQMKETKLKPGTYIKPVYTDMKTFVMFVTKDGQEGMIDIWFEMGDYIPIIHGELQDYYMELMYAG